MIERGLIEPTPVERERLATILGVSGSTLFRSVVRKRLTQAESMPHV